MTPEDITGLILAGGRGTRMGSIDKGLQMLRGEPMVAHVLHRLAPQVGPLIINANRNVDTYAKFGKPVYPDTIEGFAGPLAGLHTGLLHCDTPWVVSVPCDSPFLPPDLVARLAAALGDGTHDLAIAVTGGGESAQRHPVFCLLRASLRDQLGEFLASGGRKPDIWFDSLNTATVHFDDEHAFENINTLAELRGHDGIA